MTLTQTSRNRLILFALWVVFYASFTLFLPPLLDDADSVHAEVAREMLLRHDWVTLYANGIRYLEKAPILYWSMALSFKLFGVNTAAARLPDRPHRPRARPRSSKASPAAPSPPAPAFTPASCSSPASASSSSPASSSPTPTSASGSPSPFYWATEQEPGSNSTSPTRRRKHP